VKAPKYRNVKTTVDGITFDSAKEARRYSELRLLERAGNLSELVLQPRFPLVVNGEKICTYVADFSYRPLRSDTPTIEDVKGVKTPIYNLKKRLMKAVYGIIIHET
jgi:hypothetical protein